MKPPFILCDGNDVSIFKNMEDLKRYIESPDITSYQLFDADGNVLKLILAQGSSVDFKGFFRVYSVAPVEVKLDESIPNNKTQLETILCNFLKLVDPSYKENHHLDDLISSLINTVGYTN
jgi:hypothetical protein